MADDESKKVNDDEVIEIPESSSETDLDEEQTTELSDNGLDDESAEGERIIVKKTNETTNKETKTIVEKVIESPPEQTSASENANLVPKDKEPKHKVTRSILFLFLGVLVAVAVGAYYFIVVKNPEIKDPGSPIGFIKKEIDNEKQPFTPKKLANGDTQIDDRIWFAVPVKLDKSKYQVFDPSVEVSDSLDASGKVIGKIYSHEFYQVGKKTDGTEIVQLNPENIDAVPALVLVNSGKVTLLKKHSKTVFDDNGQPYSYSKLAGSTDRDEKTEFIELNAPKEITLKGKTFQLDGDTDSRLLLYKKADYKDYDETIYGVALLQNQENNSDSHRTERYVVRKYNFMPAFYQPKPIIKTIEKGKLSFQGGGSSTDSYSTGFHGCSLGGSFHDVLTDNDELIPDAAQDNSGNKYYSLKTEGKVPRIIQETLDSYNQFNDKKITMNEYLKSRPIFIYKDSLDQNVVIYNDSLIPAGGCGKPVIYLYPTQTTNVSVKVDADVRVSYPAYGSGWNVLAHPDGVLDYAGSSYDSLFWEGYSNYYPEISGEGFVAAQGQLETVMRLHLSQLGLNNKESDDFMEFWLPKMPKTPYVRLTWFKTATVDRIAPLDVLPKPDTTIRIFLDFEGLDRQTVLRPQNLTSIPRKGFTLVEWGGLLKQPFGSKE